MSPATWLVRNAQVSIEQTKVKAARRIAPRRSLRPSRRLRRAISAPPTTRMPRNRSGKSRRVPESSAAARGFGADGSTVRRARRRRAVRERPLLRRAADGRRVRACSRPRPSGCPRTREEATAARPAKRPRRRARLRREESTNRAAADGAWGSEDGTASKRIRRPSGSSSTPTIPLVVSGGSLSVTTTPRGVLSAEALGDERAGTLPVPEEDRRRTPVFHVLPAVLRLVVLLDPAPVLAVSGKAPRGAGGLLGVAEPSDDLLRPFGEDFGRLLQRHVPVAVGAGRELGGKRQAREDQDEAGPRGRGFHAFVAARGGDHFGRGRLAGGDGGGERIASGQRGGHGGDRARPRLRILLEAAQDDALDDRDRSPASPSRARWAAPRRACAATRRASPPRRPCVPVKSS